MTRISILVGSIGLAAAFVVAGLVPWRTMSLGPLPPRVVAPSFDEFSSSPLRGRIGLLFMHHAVGEQLLADPGMGKGQHPNGGGAFRLLQDNGYDVHAATLGSKYGEHNFLFDWLPKFNLAMGDLLRIERQDLFLPEPARNRVILFKSCFDNSKFLGPGTEPGSPTGPELTLANAKASFRALLPVLVRQSDTLFVYVTTPPLALGKPESLLKVRMKRLLGKPTVDERSQLAAIGSRAFHDWIVTPSGWLGLNPPRNVVVFDYYDLLTKQGSEWFLSYPTGDGTDNHPNAEVNREAARALVTFLNRAVRRAGISD